MVIQQKKILQVEEMVVVFNDHATKITEVAKLTCFMSNNCDGVKMVRFAASQTENLCPQVRLIFIRAHFFVNQIKNVLSL